MNYEDREKLTKVIKDVYKDEGTESAEAVASLLEALRYAEYVISEDTVDAILIDLRTACLDQIDFYSSEGYEEEYSRIENSSFEFLGLAKKEFETEELSPIDDIRDRYGMSDEEWKIIEEHFKPSIYPN